VLKCQCHHFEVIIEKNGSLKNYEWMQNLEEGLDEEQNICMV
jgi:hypothetical protein